MDCDFKPEKDWGMKIMRISVRNASLVTVLPLMLVLILVMGPRGYAQAQAQPAEQTKVAEVRASDPAVAGAPVPDTGSTNSKVAEPAAKLADPAVPPEVTKELELMKARIDQLESELKERAAPTAAVAMAAPAQPQTESSPPAAAAPPAVDNITPFAYADWTWLNGNPRNKDAVWDSKFFTPEIRFDTNFVSSFNHPKDDTLGGSTEIFRSNEIQIEQISFGGDLHWQNVRGRVLTLGGMFGVTTPRNDASAGRGQWDLRGAYKYVSEANAGYHFDVNHGLNIDAGIFVSYIGLFSYYNFDNWTYQPSYVSSNTPWFFNGLRIQWFPTDKLKIEPWIINGWQSYGRLGTKPGLGGQILWRPKPWVSMVFNNYGMGEDTLWTGNVPLGRSRIHIN